MTRVVIDRLVIQGLAGSAPTRQAVEQAVRAAMAGRAPATAQPAPPVTLPAGTGLQGAARAAADAAFGGATR